MTWFKPKGELVRGGADPYVEPANAGWTYSGMQVYTLDGSTVTVELGGSEAVIVPLSAQDIAVTVTGAHIDPTEYTLVGRSSVFEAVSDWLYVPVGATIAMTGAAGAIAVCTAVASESFPVHYGNAADVPVEVRGGGKASRQVNNIATPDSFTGAHKINICEVITPGGNFSSWPPHRHDGIGDCTTTNEEIYYFLIDDSHSAGAGEGYMHVYTVDGSVDESATVRSGDTYLIPEGYHGPTIAPPEYSMYFLNVLAGPGAKRSMAFCDDPKHHWIRESWETQDQDPRLPLTRAVSAPTSNAPLSSASTSAKG